MAMEINDRGSSGGVQKTPAQIAAEIARNRRIMELKSQISKLEADVKKLETKKAEFKKMIGDLGTALGYLEQARGETENIGMTIARTYTGNNARTYVSQIDNAEGDIDLNISKINTVSSTASVRLEEIEKEIEKKKIKIYLNKRELSRI